MGIIELDLDSKIVAGQVESVYFGILRDLTMRVFSRKKGGVLFLITEHFRWRASGPIQYKKLSWRPP